MTGRRGIGYRFGQLCCWVIAGECLGGLAFDAARAGSYVTVLLLVLLAVVSRLAHHKHRRGPRQ